MILSAPVLLTLLDLWKDPWVLRKLINILRYSHSLIFTTNEGDKEGGRGKKNILGVFILNMKLYIIVSALKTAPLSLIN